MYHRKLAVVTIVGLPLSLSAYAPELARGQACLLLEGQKLTASDAAADDVFGGSVSINGDRAVVGANSDDDAGDRSGSAYVFRRDNHGTPLDPSDDFWVEEDKLAASDAASWDMFGSSVCVSGDRAVVGAHGNNDAGGGSGSAYVFRHDDNGTPLDPSDDFWVQEDKLTASDTAADDQFGLSVAISGDHIIVGARYDDDAGSESGSAYMFRRDDNSTPSDPSDDIWVEEDKVTASDAAAGDKFGEVVSIDGDRVMVGARGNDDAGDQSGSAYVFRRDDNGTPLDPSDDFWVQEAKLTAPDAAEDDRFCIVAIREDWGFVGAYVDDDAGIDSGSVYVFRRDDKGTPSDPSDDFWVQVNKLTAPDAGEGDWFGQTISITGNRAVVGARRWDAPGASDAGSAYVFRRDDGGTPLDPSDDFWVYEAKLTASDSAADDDFSCAVSIDDGWVIVGAPYDDHAAGADSGSAYLFDLLAPDCNGNGIHDECDIADGTSQDYQPNGVPDECEPEPSLAAPYPHNRRRNRYVSFDPNLDNSGLNVAFKVELKSLTLGSCDDSGSPDVEGWPCRTDDDCRACSDVVPPANDPPIIACWTAPLHCPPGETCDLTGAHCINDQAGSVGRSWWVGPESGKGNDVHLMVSESYRTVSSDWPPVVHVADCEIVPVATYEVMAVNVNTSAESDPLLVSTAAKPDNYWADCVGALGMFCTGDWAPCGDAVCQPPPTNTCDLGAQMCGDGFTPCGDAVCPPGESCQEQWPPPDGYINFQDVTAAVFTFQQVPGLTVSDIENLDLHGAGGGDPNVDPPNYAVNFADIADMISAFQGYPYKYSDPGDCPVDVVAWP